MNRWRIIAALLAAGITTHARAQHAGDIAIDITDGRLRTSTYDADLQPTPARVFPVVLGSTGVPHFSADPGYEAAIGALMGGMRLGWKSVAPLQRWSGGDFVNVTDARLEFRYLTASFTAGTSPVTGFTLLVPSSGAFHKHLNMTLKASAGEPPPGAYLLAMQLYGTSPTMEGDTYWLLVNESLGDAAFAAVLAEARRRFEPAACPEDVDGSGEVDSGDVALALLDFGPCAGCAVDLDGTGDVDFGDIALILLASGPCP